MSYYTEDWVEKGVKLFGWFILLLIIAAIVFAIRTDKKIAESEKVHNVRAVIVEMNGKDVAYVGKQHIPTDNNTVLFKVVKDGYANTFFKLSQHNSQLGSMILNDSWMYNHAVGDTVFFEYISSKRFFQITRK